MSGNTKNLQLIIKEVESFIRGLTASPEGEEGNLPKFEVHFSSPTGFSVYLAGEKAKEYRRLLRRIVEGVTKNHPISAKQLEKLLQQTILKSCDLGQENDQIEQKTPEHRLQAAIRNLQEAISAEPRQFEVYIPVGGLSQEGLPVTVRNVLFCIFDDTEFQRFREIAELRGWQHQDSETLMLGEDILNQPCAKVSVKAVDPTAARTITQRDLRIALDIINFFSDLVPYHPGHLFLLGEAEQTVRSIPALVEGKEPSIYLHQEVAGPGSSISMARIQKADIDDALGFKIACAIKSSGSKNLKERVLTAIQWAGRATVDNRKEESFLLYAIALESLILAENDHAELLTRLSTRVAHLMGNDVASRIQISSQVKDLYKIRSGIVHNGRYQVTDSDLALIRFFAKNCIVHILRDEPFRSMSSIDDLKDWFNEQTFR